MVYLYFFENTIDKKSFLYTMLDVGKSPTYEILNHKMELEGCLRYIEERFYKDINYKLNIIDTNTPQEFLNNINTFTKMLNSNQFETEIKQTLIDWRQVIFYTKEFKNILADIKRLTWTHDEYEMNFLNQFDTTIYNIMNMQLNNWKYLSVFKKVYKKQNEYFNINQILKEKFLNPDEIQKFIEYLESEKSIEENNVSDNHTDSENNTGLKKNRVIEIE